MTIELKNVIKRVKGETYIFETSLELKENCFNILLGTTLAGKTTLLQLMAGLAKPTSGEIWFQGRNVTQTPVQKRGVAMVHQQFINYPNLSVFENIASPLKVAGVGRREYTRRVEQVADLLRLTPLLRRRPQELSGGQQQRTALARALVKEAPLVLLDEPLANLDYKLREEMRDELPRLFRDRGCTVVYATSEPGEALLLGGYTATVHQGRVTQFGPTVEVYRQPLDLTTATVFSDPPINTVSVIKRLGKFQINGNVEWNVPDTLARIPDGTFTMGMRPHHVTPEAANGAGLMVTGTVLVTELSGSESVVHFDMGGITWISQSHGIHPLQIGMNARFRLDTDKALFFEGGNQRIAY
ncbi:MAG: ABC transporter ATP-binding protein [Deltaproteobacteria bacterium]|nr:ABC transporter ATP-binding protein [Deltaproteobacteria bacterium]